MIETLEKAPHDIERQILQNRLARIDREPEKLQTFIGELYLTQAENPQILYAAATHLTALTYLDHRADVSVQPELPDRTDAGRAFETYARLMAMLGDEKDSPLFADNERIRRRLTGTLEELAFHTTLTYATAQGADFVALPSPSAVDFVGETQASDVQLFLPEGQAAPTEIQVKFNLTENGGTYEPHIAVLNLATALNSSKSAGNLRGLLKDIGSRDDHPGDRLKLDKREHGIIMEGAAAILRAATNWEASRRA